MTIYCVAKQAAFCCGIVELGLFSTDYPKVTDILEYRGVLEDVCYCIKADGYAFVTASFIDTKECKEAFEALNKNIFLSLECMSIPRINKNYEEKNKVFVAVWRVK